MPNNQSDPPTQAKDYFQISFDNKCENKNKKRGKENSIKWKQTRLIEYFESNRFQTIHCDSG